MKKNYKILGYLGLFAFYLWIAFAFPSLTPLGSFGISPAPYSIDETGLPLNNLRQSMRQIAERHNQILREEDCMIQQIYDLSKKDLGMAIMYVDSLISGDTSLTPFQIRHIHTIMGEILYDHDSLELALARFEKNFTSPRNMVNMAATYAKQRDFKKAEILLKQAYEVNYDFHWYLGNLYEMQKEPEKAIIQYQLLFEKDTAFYDFCKQRIEALQILNTALYSEIQFRNRGKRFLFLFNL